MTAARKDTRMKPETRSFLRVLALLSALASAMLLFGDLMIGPPPKASCKTGKCDWYSFTYQQCGELCSPAQVKSYDPNAYWMNGRPTSRYPSPPCLCGSGAPQ
jgi:hypothetical protein